jgi:hypothetical protein
MLQQLKEDAIPLFERLHPNCIGVFCFDNSSNHQAYSPDALVATRMTLNEKAWPESEEYQFRDSSVLLRDQTMMDQQFYFHRNENKARKNGKVEVVSVRYFKGNEYYLTK